VPAILTDNPKELEKLVRSIETFTDYAQFDIMDGKFVPTLSYSSDDIAGVKPALRWEAHLMVMQPEDYLDGFKKAGASRILFHYEATSIHMDIITRIKNLGLEVGLVVNPETPVSAILPLVRKLDSVLFMTVHPGYYGSKFLPEVLDKVAEFRRIEPDIEISVDGGIKEDNIAQVAAMGVDVICVGSAISMQPEPAESYTHLLNLAQAGALNSKV